MSAEGNGIERNSNCTRGSGVMTVDRVKDPMLSEITDRSWMVQALCRGVDTERWFDPKPPKFVRRHIREVCSSCPVAMLCLSHALVNNEQYGAWGGRTMTVLRPLQRRFAAGESLSSVLNTGISGSVSSRSSDAA